MVQRGIAWSRRAHVTCGDGRYQIVMPDSRRRPRSASFASLNGKVARIEALLGTFGMVCSTDLTGPDGPTQFWFARTDQEP